MSQHDSIARFLPGETQAGDAKGGTITADEAMLIEELSYIDRMRNRQGGENQAPHGSIASRTSGSSGVLAIWSR